MVDDDADDDGDGDDDDDDEEEEEINWRDNRRSQGKAKQTFCVLQQPCNEKEISRVSVPSGHNKVSQARSLGQRNISPDPPLLIFSSWRLLSTSSSP